MIVFVVMTSWGEDDPSIDSIWSQSSLANRRVKYLTSDPDDYTLSRFHVFVLERVMDDPALPLK